LLTAPSSIYANKRDARVTTSRWLWLLPLALLIADTVFSFMQFVHLPLDGDLAPIVLPSEFYAKVMSDPFGWQAVAEHQNYAGSNRFFAHWSMAAYFRVVPIWLQRITDPINSLYLSAALAKTAMQLGLISLLVAYTRLFVQKPIHWAWLALLVFPLFQTGGFHISMGVIDESITYTFFYALPNLLLLLFFLPIVRQLVEPAVGHIDKIHFLFLFMLAPVLAFHGPLVPGIALVISFVSGIQHFISGAQSKKSVRFLLFWLSTLCLYSLYVGSFNQEGLTSTVSLSERFMKLPGGIYRMLCTKIGLPLLVVTTSAQFIWLYKKGLATQQVRLALWLFLGSVLFTLLLPFGGYREYRPEIIRRDTAAPVLTILFFLFALSGVLVQQHSSGKRKWLHRALLALFLCVFTLADARIKKKNQCEREALNQIAQSTQTVVVLKTQCTIMAWDLVRNADDSRTNTDFLMRLNIIKSPKLYRQE
jgi:hypothetical protein